MIHTKFPGHRPAGSVEEDFTFYGHGRHLGHVTSIISTNFNFQVHKSLHTKFG